MLVKWHKLIVDQLVVLMGSDGFCSGPYVKEITAPRWSCLALKSASVR